MKLADIITEMSDGDIRKTESIIDQMFRSIGLDVHFTKHFKDRISDNSYESRDSDVTPNELLDMFSNLKTKYGKQLLDARKNPREFFGILQDSFSALNIPFKIDYDKVHNGLHQLNTLTLMRKKNFVPNSPRDKIFTVKTH